MSSMKTTVLLLGGPIPSRSRFLILASMEFWLTNDAVALEALILGFSTIGFRQRDSVLCPEEGSLSPRKWSVTGTAPKSHEC